MKTSILRSIKSFFVATLLISGLLINSGAVRATTVTALDFSSTQNWGFGAGLTIGWGFQVDEAQLVSQLGYYDLEGDGLVFDHQVGLFRVSDLTLLTSGVVTSTDTLDGLFRYTDVASALLNPGEQYFIAGYDPEFCPGGLNPCGPADPHDRVGNPTASDLVFASYINYEGWQSETSTSLDFTSYNPTLDPWALSDGPLIVANFKSSAVPEPGSLLLMGLGIIGLVAGRKKLG